MVSGHGLVWRARLLEDGCRVSSGEPAGGVSVPARVLNGARWRGETPGRRGVKMNGRESGRRRPDVRGGASGRLSW